MYQIDKDPIERLGRFAVLVRSVCFIGGRQLSQKLRKQRG
jgi:hypothetical protein